MLASHGYSFHSETDSEVLVQLVEKYQVRYQLCNREALGRALQDVQGSFAVVLHDTSSPNELLAARRQSPLVIGVGDSDFLISSDSMTFSDTTKEIIYLEEDIIAQLSQDKVARFYTLEDQIFDQEVMDFDYL
ncbi:MAG: glucosamine--fructose-6-phosphate aminotransferase (isomerizing) [Saprospiraceae bacterium]|jgi:glucosamine--fructose-6-phosphate aminotransferase (isomerizing)